MISKLYSIASNTFTEAIRQPIFLAGSAFVGIVLILAMFMSNYTLDDDNKFLIEMGLSMVFVGGMVLASLLASGVLAREIDNKTVLTVISKPIGRPVFILGKFFGVIAATGMAFWIWVLIFCLLLRQGVMSTAADRVDFPVVVFVSLAVALSAFIAVWGNYFYGWVFISRFMVLLSITLSLAALAVLLVNKHWEFQPITREFAEHEGRLVQVLLALLLVFLGVTILGSVAIACSTRLGQIMTLLICIGVFFIGAASDYWFGRNLASHPLAWIGYAAAPNVQFLFVADAMSQNVALSAGYIKLVLAYGALYTTGALCLAIALFQTRETG